jgi:hypothetical protein
MFESISGKFVRLFIDAARRLNGSKLETSKNDDIYSLLIYLINLKDIASSRYVKGNTALNLLNPISRKSKEQEFKCFWDNIENKAGKFDDLDNSFRHELIKAAYFHIQEINRLVRLSSFNLPNIFSLIAKCIINIGWKFQNEANKNLGHFIRLFGRKLYNLGIRLQQKYLALFLFSRYFEAPIIYYIWKYLKYDPTEIIQNYINEIPIDRRIAPVFKFSRKNSICCSLIGLDFLSSNGNLYFLESNFNAAHLIGRHRAFEDGDTVCHHLCAYARDLNFEKVIFYPTNISTFSVDLEKEWKKIAKNYDVEMRIIDAPHIGSPAKRKTDFLIENTSNNTIYLNGRWINSPLGRLVYKKGLLEKEIEMHNRKTNFHSILNLPKKISSDDDLLKIEQSDELPNIILKNMYLDQRKGIRLFKADRLPQFNKYHEVAYEFLKLDLVKEAIDGVERKYAYYYRTLLLLSPSGPHYVGATKIVNTIAVPSIIERGSVKDTSPFLFSSTGTAKNEQLSYEEDIKCKQATLKAGNVICKFLRKKHNWKPSQTPKS